MWQKVENSPEAARWAQDSLSPGRDSVNWTVVPMRPLSPASLAQRASGTASPADVRPTALGEQGGLPRGASGDLEEPHGLPGLR